MRITLQIDGGLASFPALRKPRTLEVDALPTAEREKICALVDDVCKAPHVARPAPPGAADLRSYTLDIEDGARHSTIKVTDPIADERLSTLLEILRAHVALR